MAQRQISKQDGCAVSGRDCRLPDNKTSDYNMENFLNFRHFLIIKMAIRFYL